MKQRPFAVFDIDGTIIRWQLYHAVADRLARDGHLDSKQYAEIRAARLVWKQRQQTSSYSDYEEALVEFFNQAVTDIKVELVMAACQEVIAKYKDQVYTYTRELIKQLKQQDYLLFAISASQDEMVRELADYYGFDDAGGSTYEIRDGRYTGKSSVLKSDLKPEFLKELVAKHGATWQGSIAVGDSESDIDMLSVVEQPIAFNPTRELFETAKREGWRVVIERKHMVYELEAKNGSYVLV